jgi:hypothetical protein
MSIAKSDGKMQFWDFGEPIEFVQNNNKTYALQFWDMGEPLIYGEVSTSGMMFLLMVG